ncbi:metallophosphoesterase [Nonomuraea sp. NPDC046802]|uniref:metallophosphoesterase n=1 Tax=Nonomuraea sp. NPDC046802 TaxID=3154919 RepID=UPI0033DB2CBD
MATTDVHSSFDQPLPMLAYLHKARERALVVDCGDFFEGSGYYRLGGGRIERQALILLYDVIAPGNHGWRHHFEPDLRAMTVCANATDAGTGEPLFRQVRIETIAGRRVGVTGVIGEQAFATIPLPERTGHHIIRPEAALHELRARYRDMVDDWIVLSHSGFDHDLTLAERSPFVSVIFSGHCHSEQHGPAQVGNTLVVKGHELGAGYAEAQPYNGCWAARTQLYPDVATMPEAVAVLLARIQAIHDRLISPLGLLAKPFRDTVPDRHEILTLVARRLRACLSTDAVLFNDTSLRPVHLGTVLREGDLLAIEPFGNQLVHAHIAGDPQTLLDALADRVGPLVIDHAPDTPELRCALTTRHLADTFLGGRWNGPPRPLAAAVQAVLTGRTETHRDPHRP